MSIFVPRSLRPAAPHARATSCGAPAGGRAACSSASPSAPAVATTTRRPEHRMQGGAVASLMIPVAIHRSWRLSSSGEKEGNVTLRDATSTSIIATTLAGLLFTGGALPALAEERMSEEQMMQQFGECIRNTCEAELVACMSADGVEDEKCLEELGCIGRCSIMDAPKVSGVKQRLPPNKVKQATRKVADEVLKDSAVAVREVEKALLDYEQPMKGFPGGLLGI